MFCCYSNLNPKFFTYKSSIDVFLLFLFKNFSNEFVFTTLQKYNLINLLFSIFKQYKPVVRETFLYQYRKKTFKNVIFNILYNYLLKVTKPLVLVQSHNCEKDFIKTFNYKNILVINNPIDPYVLSKHKAVNIYSEYIIYVGRLVYDKGIHDLISVYSKSNLPHSGINLLICGDGNYKNELVQLVKNLKLSNKIIFLGNVLKPLPLITNSKFLVLPSYHEAFPNVLLESIGLKKLFISKNIGSVRELCMNNCSLLYNSNEDLLKKLNSFISLSKNKENCYLSLIKKLAETYSIKSVLSDFDHKILNYVSKN